MSQVIKIKRSTGSGVPSTIAAGELAYSKGSGTLYIGDPDTSNPDTPIPIGGAIINNAGTPVLGNGVTETEIRDLIELGTTHNPTFNNLTLNGNLTVNGTTTTLNTATLDVQDTNITLNHGSGDTSGSANGAGITIQDAVGGATPTDASITWNTTGNAFNFSNAIQLGGTTLVSSSRRIYASDGTDLKAAYGFSSSSTTGLSYKASGNGIKFLAGGAVKAYIQTGSSNPITPVMYVDGRTEINGRVFVTDDGNSGNWKDAYDWGDHADAGYLTSYTETDTLASVTGRGAVTTNNISVGSLSASGSNNAYAGVFTGAGGPSVTSKGLHVKAGATSADSILLVEKLDGTDVFTIDGLGVGAFSQRISVQSQDITSARIQNWQSAYSWGDHGDAGYGTITSIEIESTDGSISGIGTGTTGALTFDLEVATIDGGTY